MGGSVKGSYGVFALVCCVCLATGQDTTNSTTTTDKTTTTAQAPNTTTASTTMATTLASTTMAPSKEGKWEVIKRGTENKTCVLFDANIKLILKLKTPAGEENGTKIETKVLIIPSSNYSAEVVYGKVFSVPSTCNNDSADMTLKIESKNANETGLGFLNFKFNLDGSTVVLDHICLMDDETALNSIKRPQVCVYTKAVKTPDDRSYQCNAKQTYAFNVTGKSASSFYESAHIDLSDVRFEFRAEASESTDFMKPHLCPADSKTNDLVPIIVGACLAGLVVIVLIAYLVGRARAKQQTGYESV